MVQVLKEAEVMPMSMDCCNVTSRPLSFTSMRSAELPCGLAF